MESKERLELFDFDGTLTTGDTMVPFMRYAVGDAGLLAAVVRSFPQLLACAFHIVTTSRAKEALFSACFRGMPYSEFLRRAEGFAARRGGGMLRKEIVEKMQEALTAERCRVAVVSASMEEWIAPCLKQEIVGEMPVILSTRPEVNEDGIMTGKFAMPNCRGVEKVKRIKAEFGDISQYSITAYGNSAGDREMLAIAQNGILVKK